jgi:hypothetical protein
MKLLDLVFFVVALVVSLLALPKMRIAAMVILWVCAMLFADVRLFAAEPLCNCQQTGVCTCGPNCTCAVPIVKTAAKQGGHYERQCTAAGCMTTWVADTPAAAGDCASGNCGPAAYGNGPVRGFVRGSGRVMGRVGRGAFRVITAPFRLFRGRRGC